ncbi:DUF262 domain-containing protein [Agromyces sp. NPDC057679]|uniref:DUF262 domain-containing protein n=1 Tax=Agromyces sp. NPDC057679 TaxID=3346207 RepID=UPI00366C5127
MKKTMQTAEPLKHTTMQAMNRRAAGFVQDASSGYLQVDPPYQRPSVWTEDQRRNLIRSWMLGLSVPAIIVSDRARWNGITADEPWTALVDGRQRVETAIRWFEGDLAVPASWFQPDHVLETEDTDDGPYVRFTGLTVVARRLLDTRAMLPSIEIEVKSVEEEAEIFLLVNTGGTAQTDDDLERARQVAVS